MNDFRDDLSRLDPERWDRVLDALKLGHELGTKVVGFDDDLDILSAYRGGLGISQARRRPLAVG